MTLGNVANISLSYDDGLTRFSTGYSNSISPSGIGQALQTDSIFVNYSYKFARHLFLDVSGTFSRSQATGTRGSNFDRDYLTTGAYIAWEFEKNWQLNGGYVYSFQQYKQDQIVQSLVAQTSDFSTVMIFLNYAWNGIRDSR